MLVRTAGVNRHLKTVIVQHKGNSWVCFKMRQSLYKQHTHGPIARQHVESPFWEPCIRAWLPSQFFSFSIYTITLVMWHFMIVHLFVSFSLPWPLNYNYGEDTADMVYCISCTSCCCVNCFDSSTAQSITKATNWLIHGYGNILSTYQYNLHTAVLTHYLLISTSGYILCIQGLTYT